MTLAAWFRGAIDSELDALLAREVDDLAKLNLLMLMRHDPDLRADAATFAKQLGFHSVEQTEQKLKQLVACGLVRAEPPSDADIGGPRYGLATEEPARRRLAKLWRLSHREAYYTSLLHHLAERSCEEAAAHYQEAEKAKAR